MNIPILTAGLNQGLLLKSVQQSTEMSGRPVELCLNVNLNLLCYVIFLLSSKNFAHQLFKRMSEKNSRTYEAMILSLLKVTAVYFVRKISD